MIPKLAALGCLGLRKTQAPGTPGGALLGEITDGTWDAPIAIKDLNLSSIDVMSTLGCVTVMSHVLSCLPWNSPPDPMHWAEEPLPSTSAHPNRSPQEAENSKLNP